MNPINRIKGFVATLWQGTSPLGLSRLTIGFLQGVLLCTLYFMGVEKAWPTTEPYFLLPFSLVSVSIPILWMLGLSHLRRKQLVIWLMAALSVVTALSVYFVWRSTGFIGRYLPELPLFSFVLHVAFMLFIMHALVLAGARDKRWLAHYSTYFEIAWRSCLQLLLSPLFVGVLWLALLLGIGLFKLVGLDFLQHLIALFWIPITVFGFASAIHLTDVSFSLISNIRKLLLSLLAWILPITTLIVMGFEAGLLSTGLEPLWATHHAVAILLTTALFLFVLINAAFQNGDPETLPPKLIRISARLAALASFPVVAIAIYALGLRVMQHGWTVDRIIASACLVVASIYAVGYVVAACRLSHWLKGIAKVNAITAYVVVGILLALLSPIADPSRLSVNDQMNRLATGKTKAREFDFSYLRFEGARYGLMALETLKKTSQGADAAWIREQADLALKAENRYEKQSPPSQPSPAEIVANVKVYPSPLSLPVSFVQKKWDAPPIERWKLPSCLIEKKQSCDAYLIDFDGDGKAEVLLTSPEGFAPVSQSPIFKEDKKGDWKIVARLSNELSRCKPWLEKMRAGAFKTVPSQLRALEIDNQRIELEVDGVDLSCPSPQGGK